MLQNRTKVEEGSIGNTIKVAMIKNPIDRLIHHYRNKYQESLPNLGQNFSQFVTRLIDKKLIPVEVGPLTRIFHFLFFKKNIV